MWTRWAAWPSTSWTVAARAVRPGWHGPGSVAEHVATRRPSLPPACARRRPGAGAGGLMLPAPRPSATPRCKRPTREPTPSWSARRTTSTSTRRASSGTSKRAPRHTAAGAALQHPAVHLYAAGREAVQALAAEPRILGIKDSWGDLPYFQSLLRSSSPGRIPRAARPRTRGDGQPAARRRRADPGPGQRGAAALVNLVKAAREQTSPVSAAARGDLGPDRDVHHRTAWSACTRRARCSGWPTTGRRAVGGRWRREIYLSHRGDPAPARPATTGGERSESYSALDGAGRQASDGFSDFTDQVDQHRPRRPARNRHRRRQDFARPASPSSDRRDQARAPTGARQFAIAHWGARRSRRRARRLANPRVPASKTNLTESHIPIRQHECGADQRDRGQVLEHHAAGAGWTKSGMMDQRYRQHLGEEQQHAEERWRPASGDRRNRV